MARPRKNKQALPPAPAERFVIINLDCNNVEHVAHTLDEAHEVIADNIYPQGRDWSADDIRILHVTEILQVRATKIVSEAVEINNIDNEV